MNKNILAVILGYLLFCAVAIVAYFVRPDAMSYHEFIKTISYVGLILMGIAFFD